MTVFLVTGLVLIALPVAFNLAFFALGRAFDYPGILREPTEQVLRRFQAGGGRLISLWYFFAMTALLAIPMALLVQQVFAPDHPELAAASAIIGTLSGLVQALGLFRWTFLVPSLAQQYTAVGTSAEARTSIAVVFNAFHQYLGVAIGEHLGYLFTAGWTVLVSIMMLNSAIFPPVLAILGIAAAVGILSGLLEPAGWKLAGALNAVSYIVWSLWLIIAGLTLVFA